MKDSDEALFQEEYWEIKNKNDKKHLEAMNREIEEEFGKDPCKLHNFFIHVLTYMFLYYVQ